MLVANMQQCHSPAHEHPELQISFPDNPLGCHAVYRSGPLSTLRSVRTGSGELSVFAFGEPHRLHWGSAGGIANLYLTQPLLASVAEDIASGSAFEIPTIAATRDPIFLQLLQMLRSEHREYGIVPDLILDTALVLCSARLLRHFAVNCRKKTVASHLDAARLNRSIEFIHAHLDRPISLQQLAQVAGVSLYYFARSFKQFTGTSPHRYLQQARIHRAKDLLASTPLGIGEIGFQTGYPDAAHFSALFLKTTGISPSQYRKTSGSRVK